MYLKLEESENLIQSFLSVLIPLQKQQRFDLMSNLDHFYMTKRMWVWDAGYF